MPGRFAENHYYVEYEALLKRLHELNATGRGETEEADLLRDEMDRPYGELDAEEIERLRGLSADLQMLQDDEIFEPLEPGEDAAERTPEQLRQWLQAARDSGDLETALAVMRKGPLPIARDQIAYLRASLYASLGHPATALLFMRYAAQLAPQNETYELMLLRILMQAGREEEARSRAVTHLQNESSTPSLLVQSAAVLYQAMRGPLVQNDNSVYEQAIQGLERALVQADRPEAFIPAVAISGYAMLGVYLQKLGRTQEAHKAFDEALARDPDNNDVLVARGLLRLETHPDDAYKDFQRAAECNTADFKPYFYLAHQALGEARYEDCLRWCAKVLEKTENPRMRAQVIQWAAIARYELHHPAVMVQRAFETAITLDPLDQQIRENFLQFQGATRIDRSAPADSLVWQTQAKPDAEETTWSPPQLPIAA